MERQRLHWLSRRRTYVSKLLTFLHQIRPKITTNHPPLYSCAVGEDKLPHVEYLLTHGANPNANLRGDLYTALEIGAMFASPAVLNLLLTHGAILEHRSALNKAAYVGRLDNINLLLDKGAAINAIPDNENIPDLVGQNGIGTALHDAAEADKADVVRLLLERGADRLVKDTAGHTAREVAVKKGHDECARLLE